MLGIASLASTHSVGEPTTLAEYVERMKPSQEQIFYATGESLPLLLKSPQLEAFKAKGYAVLLFTDPVDEVWVGFITRVRRQAAAIGCPGRSGSRLRREQGRARDESERREQERDFADLLEWLQETLSDNISEVRLSSCLTESPACLINRAFGITTALARMYRASGQDVSTGKRILEVTPNTPGRFSGLLANRLAPTLPPAMPLDQTE